MTTEEMIAYARKIADGAKPVKSELTTFMVALLAGADGTVDAPATVAGSAPVIQPVSPVPIQVTDTGRIHLSRECNRFYTPLEALALAAALDRTARELI